MKPIFALLALVTITVVGCRPAPLPVPPPAPPQGGVAILDVEAVAKRLGRDVAIVAELKEASAPLSDQLAATQKDYQAQIEKLKSSLGSKPTEADLKKLAELERTLNQQFQQKQQQAQQELNAKRVNLVNRFREEIKPVALKIASAKGRSTVLIKSDAVILSSEPEVEITDEVVAELNRPASTTTAPVPIPTP